MSIELQPVQVHDRDEVIRLFAEYPFKTWQKKAQGIDPERLAPLLWDLAEPRFGKPRTSALIAWRRKPRQALGLGVVAPHAWHSEVFGRSMGRMVHFVNTIQPDVVGPLLLDRLLAEARHAGLEHVSGRLDGQDWPNIQLFESRGFRCVDCSLKMARRLDDVAPETGVRAGEGVEIRPYEPSDLEAIQRIAARSHARNHFYNDPGLSREKAAALFQLWLDRCASKLAQFILVAEMPDGRIGGFVIGLSNQALARVVGLSVGIIDYIVVDRDLGGRGIGRALLEAALRRLARDHQWAELRTSHDNYQAVGFYGAAGFRILASDFVFHRWESEAAGR